MLGVEDYSRDYKASNENLSLEPQGIKVFHILVGGDCSRVWTSEVQFQLSGTAGQGSDYTVLVPNQQIAGDWAIGFTPVNDTLSELTETVEFRLLPTDKYDVMTSYTQTVYEIIDDDANLPSGYRENPIDCFCTCPVCKADSPNPAQPVNTKENLQTGNVKVGLVSSHLAHNNPTEASTNVAQMITIDSTKLGTQSQFSPVLEVSGGNLSSPVTVDIRDNLNWNDASAAAGKARMVNFALNGSANFLASGRYDWVIRARSDGEVLASGSKDIIDWSFSEFGGGWYPEYLSRLIFSGSGFAWLQGSNNLFWYDGTKFEAGELGFSTVTDWGGGKQITTRDKTVYRFNASGLLVQQADRNGNTTSFQYQDADLDSAVDEIQKVLWPNGTTTTFTYSGLGLVTGIDEPGPMDLTLSYDTAKRLTTIQLPAPSAGASQPSMSVSYDGPSVPI